MTNATLLNVCPVCRNVNQADATVCRYCRTALTPPQPVSAVPAAPRRRVWPWVAGAVVLLLLAGGSGLAFFGGGGGGAQAAAMPLTVGTGTGASLEFEPRTIQAPANTPVDLTFNNQSTLPHNLTFEQGPDARTADIAGNTSETISFTTPALGTYRFVCTIHPGMDGELIVQ